MLIPSRVLRKWDFSKYCVSNFSKDLLLKIWNDPLFNVQDVNSALYRKVKLLNQVRVRPAAALAVVVSPESSPGSSCSLLTILLCFLSLLFFVCFVWCWGWNPGPHTCWENPPLPSYTPGPLYSFDTPIS